MIRRKRTLAILPLVAALLTPYGTAAANVDAENATQTTQEFAYYKKVNIVQVPGTVIDFDDGRILYYTGDRQSLYIMDRETGEIIPVVSQSHSIFQVSLTPDGVIFIAGRKLYEYKNGQLIDNNIRVIDLSELKVAGNYAAYRKDEGKYDDGPLILRDLITGTESVVIDSTSSYTYGKFDVSEDGTVAYYDGGISTYKDGIVTEIESDADVAEALSIQIDGSNITYYRSKANSDFKFVLHDGETLTELGDSAGRYNKGGEGRPYLSNDGWIVYPKYIDNLYYYMRSPDGEEKRIGNAIPDQEDSVTVRAVNAQGDLIFSKRGPLRYKMNFYTSEEAVLDGGGNIYQYMNNQWIGAEPGEFYEFHYTLDTTPPVTDVTFTPIGNPVTRLSAMFKVTDDYPADPLSGVSGLPKFHYRVNGGSWNIKYIDHYEPPRLTFSAEDTHTLEFRSVDLAGNVEKTWIADFDEGTFRQEP